MMSRQESPGPTNSIVMDNLDVPLWTDSINRAKLSDTDISTVRDDGRSSPVISEYERRRRKQQKPELSNLLSSHRDRRPQVPQEVEFIRAVDAGDLPTVRRMLQTKVNLNVNCSDLLGRTPLRIAVENENQEIVEELLDYAGMRNLYESLLVAISLDHDQIAVAILHHPMCAKLEKETNHFSDTSMFASTMNDDSLFAPETTPLILAAQRNRYEVLAVLIQRGARIMDPHDIMACDQDELKYTKTRLNSFKGLSSEAYICLASSDPILTAFELRRRLVKVAVQEKHYRDAYEEMMGKLSDFVVKLLDCVRGNAELDVILNHGADGEEEVLSRLKLALSYNEKKFVAHSSCQKKLTSIWYGDAQWIINARVSLPYPILDLFFFLASPFLCFAYLLAPFSRVRHLVRIPYIKFLCQTSGFIVFLVLICAFSLNLQPSALVDHIGARDTRPPLMEWKKNITDAGFVWSMQLRESIPPATQGVLNFYITGIFWQECGQLYRSSLKEYFGSLFNVMDSFSLMLYFTSFCLRYISNYKAMMSHLYFSRSEGIVALMAGDERALYRYYWLFADRYYWDAFDPVVVAEGLFAIANVVSFSRLFYLLAASEHLGPLQISLRRMIGDISRFMLIFMIIFVAFMVGLNNLYWYYEPAIRDIVENNEYHERVETQAETAFGTVEKTFTTVFWTMFGMGEHTVVTLGEGYSGGFTERVGYMVYGAYNIAIVVILLNMLIAMMSRSFDAIVAEQDIEWKFARAQLYMDYIQNGNTLPVPFNIIIPPKLIYRFLAKLLRRCTKRKDKKKEIEVHQVEGQVNGFSQLTNDKVSSMSSSMSIPGSRRGSGDSTKSSTVRKLRGVVDKLFNYKSIKRHRDLSFSTVMPRVVKRFIFKSEKVDTSQTEGDVDELKQDLSGLRFELNNLLQTNQKTIIDAINHINAKMDILQSIHGNSMVPMRKSPFNSKLYGAGRTVKSPSTAADFQDKANGDNPGRRRSVLKYRKSPFRRSSLRKTSRGNSSDERTSIEQKIEPVRLEKKAVDGNQMEERSDGKIRSGGQKVAADRPTSAHRRRKQFCNYRKDADNLRVNLARPAPRPTSDTERSYSEGSECEEQFSQTSDQRVKRYTQQDLDRLVSLLGQEPLRVPGEMAGLKNIEQDLQHFDKNEAHYPFSRSYDEEDGASCSSQDIGTEDMTEHSHSSGISDESLVKEVVVDHRRDFELPIDDDQVENEGHDAHREEHTDVEDDVYLNDTIGSELKEAIISTHNENVQRYAEEMNSAQDEDGACVITSTFSIQMADPIPTERDEVNAQSEQDQPSNPNNGSCLDGETFQSSNNTEDSRI